MEQISKQVNELNKLFEQMEQQAIGSDADVYNCTLCRDTGVIIRNNRAYPCSCRRKAHIEKKKQAAGLSPRLQRMRFASFDLSYYSSQRCTEAGDSYLSKAEMALRNARQFTRNCLNGTAERGLLLQGEIGCGKTHLAAAIANELCEHDLDVLFLVVPELLDQLRSSYNRESEGLDEAEIIKRTYEVPVLILDDMGAHNFTEWVSNKLFAIINHRYNHNLPCIITTNLELDEMDVKIGARTTSRILESCALNTMYIDRDIRLQQRPGRRV